MRLGHFKPYLIFSLYFSYILYVSGGYSKEATPVPIPNTEVKLFNANGTAWSSVWESRTLPELYLKAPCILQGAFFLPEFCTGCRSEAPKALCLKGSWNDFNSQAYYSYGED